MKEINEIDPSFMFNLDNPFPGIAYVSERLYERLGIVTRFRNYDWKGPLICDTLVTKTVPGPQWTATCAYVLYRPGSTPCFQFEQGRFNVGDGAKLHEGTVRFGMQWGVPIVEDWQHDEAPFDYFSRTRQLPYWFSEPPGVHIPDIVEWFVEYLALRQVEAWAERHLVPSRT